MVEAITKGEERDHTQKKVKKVKGRASDVLLGCAGQWPPAITATAAGRPTSGFGFGRVEVVSIERRRVHPECIRIVNKGGEGVEAWAAGVQPFPISLYQTHTGATMRKHIRRSQHQYSWQR